jgi:hypothetical protein
MFSQGSEPCVRRQRRIVGQKDLDYRFAIPQSGSSAIQYETVRDVFYRNPSVQFAKTAKVRMNLKFRVRGSSITQIEGNADFPPVCHRVEGISA